MDRSINQYPMSAQELVAKCNEALAEGIDFPTLWHTVIKPHPTVAGVPIQGWSEDRTCLEIPLLRGDRLVVDTERRTVSPR